MARHPFHPRSNPRFLAQGDEPCLHPGTPARFVQASTNSTRAKELVRRAAFYPVIDINIGGCAQALVIERKSSNRLLQLFREVVDRTEVLSRSRDLDLAALQKLLVPAVKDAGDLSAQKPSGSGKDIRTPSAAAPMIAAQPYFET